ncbi:thioredoxin domain-containing protein [uncultured Lacinutrix sp.]|uniref:thioredoxin family protein n=1 Tax=uncultured Lacinutrix sp. TaxID=574032 RepID=UPI00260A3826|nr:thioredoxin domain-containing protein [uncultured Lacinutrix sp.]
MRNIFTSLIVVLLFTSSLSADNWLYSFDDAKKMALSTNKLILVDFWATWCGPCKRMDSESWSKEEVQSLMNNYVPVKIDLDKNKSLALKYGVRGIPYVFIMDGNGKVIYQQMSYKPKNEVITLLNKYAISTQFLSQDLINYYKKDSFSNAYRLAIKYQDFCVLLNEDLRYKFIKASDSYFDEAKIALKKSGLKNKDRFSQKIKLYEIQKKIILNNSKKALKLLDKFNKNKLDEKNLQLYNYLCYIAYKKTKNIDKASEMSAKLSEKDLKKSEVFFKSEV